MRSPPSPAASARSPATPGCTGPCKLREAGIRCEWRCEPVDRLRAAKGISAGRDEAAPLLERTSVGGVTCELRTRNHGLAVARSRAPPAGITPSPGRTPRWQWLCRPSLAAGDDSAGPVAQV